MSENKDDNQDWRLKLNDLVQTCQSELKKTTKIGMKMISASQSNTELHETYETLGKWLVTEIKLKKLSVDDQVIIELVAKVADLESKLESYEKDVHDIKDS